jgi:hypothetical protein
MTVGDPGEDVGQIAKRIRVVEFAGLDQGGDDLSLPIFSS